MTTSSMSLLPFFSFAPQLASPLRLGMVRHSTPLSLMEAVRSMASYHLRNKVDPGPLLTYVTRFFFNETAKAFFLSSWPLITVAFSTRPPPLPPWKSVSCSVKS